MCEQTVRAEVKRYAERLALAKAKTLRWVPLLGIYLNAWDPDLDEVIDRLVDASEDGVTTAIQLHAVDFPDWIVANALREAKGYDVPPGYEEDFVSAYNMKVAAMGARFKMQQAACRIDRADAPREATWLQL